MSASLYYSLLDTAASSGNKNGLEWLKLPVFDVSDVSAAFPHDQDIKDQLKVPVPRRPPFENLWVECERTEKDSHPSIDNGKEFFHVWQEGWSIWRDDQLIKEVQGADFEVGATYGYLTYIMLKRTTARAHFGAMIGRPLAVESLGILALSQDWTKSGSTHIITDHPVPDPLSLHCSPWPIIDKDSAIFVAPWYPVMAFGLLNCVNVSADQEEAPKRPNEERAKKRGLPQRPGYKTLKIHVPRSTGGGGEGTGEGSPKRMHICRGHFKNLQAARYKKRGWHWWSPHLRGDPELGSVEKDYGIDMRE